VLLQISFCDLHVQSATTKFAKKEKEIDCKKCHQPLKDISNLSVSVRKLDFGRQTYESTHQDGDEDDDGEGQGTATFSFGGRTVSVQRQQYSDDEDEDEDQVMHKFGNLSTYNNEGYDYEYVIIYYMVIISLILYALQIRRGRRRGRRRRRRRR
jgi:hypothetical protein